MSARWLVGTALIAVAASAATLAVTLAVTHQSSKPTTEQILVGRLHKRHWHRWRRRSELVGQRHAVRYEPEL